MRGDDMIPPFATGIAAVVFLALPFIGLLLKNFHSTFRLEKTRAKQVSDILLLLSLLYLFLFLMAQLWHAAVSGEILYSGRGQVSRLVTYAQSPDEFTYAVIVMAACATGIGYAILKAGVNAFHGEALFPSKDKFETAEVTKYHWRNRTFFSKL